MLNPQAHADPHGADRVQAGVAAAGAETTPLLGSRKHVRVGPKHPLSCRPPGGGLTLTLIPTLDGKYAERKTNNGVLFRFRLVLEYALIHFLCFTSGYATKPTEYDIHLWEAPQKYADSYSPSRTLTLNTPLLLHANAPIRNPSTPSPAFT